jgi:uncharacterized repeat protein (TIGR02543 family)
MTLAPDGRIHYAYLEYNCASARSGLDVSNTTDGNWGSVHFIPGQGGLVDKDSTAIDPTGRLYATWDEDNILAITWTDDGGNTWAPIRDPGGVTDSVLGAIVGTFGDSAVYLTWWDINTDNIMFESSSDRGQTWSSAVRVNDRDGSAQGVGSWQIPLPAMNVDPDSGAVYIAWPDNRNGNQDIFFANSTDGGTTWGTNHKLNDDTGSASQWMVDLAIDSTGKVHAAWEDGRNGNWNILYANSTDGGQTWTANLKVTTEDTPGSYTRPGDYFALQAGPNDDIYVVWTDGRGTDFDIYYARNPGFPSATVTVTTAPAGLSVTVDNVTAKAPVTKTWTIGSGHTIGVASTIPIGSTARYNWTDWSDSGALTHVIVATTDQTYTASFKKQYLAKVAPDPIGLAVLVDNVTVTASFQGWWDDGSNHWLEAPSPQSVSADVRYVWASWSDGGSRAHGFVALGPLDAVATFLQEQGLRVSTGPENLAFTLDGIPYASTQTFWLSPDSYHTVAVQTLQPGGTGTRYVFSQWSDGGAATHVIHFTGAEALQATFHAEYYLTVSSLVPGESGTGWYADGSYAIATVTSSSYATGPGERVSFQGWQGDATGAGLSSDPILMDGPKTAVADYETQFYLDVSSPYATVAGAGWYDSGSSATARLDVAMVSISAGARAVFAVWSGDAAGSDASESAAILMDRPKTAVASWHTEYLLQVQTAYGGSTGSGWYLAGSSAYAGVSASLVEVSAGTRAAFVGWTGDTSGTSTVSSAIRMDGPKTATATWQLQYLVQVDDDLGLATGGGWYPAGARVTLQAPKDVTSGGQRYTFAGWTGDVTSPDASHVITVSAPVTVRATWTSLGTAGGFGADTIALLSAIVIVVAVCLAVLVIWWRRRKKE